MNCPNCGTSNLDTASICANCGRPLTASAAPPPPPPPPQSASYTPPPPRAPMGAQPQVGERIPNYLWQSVVVTLCCCLPLGIVGIIFGAQVNSRLAAGDVAGARDASQKAKMFMLIGFGLGLAIMIIYMLAGGAAVLEGIREGMANQ